MHDLTEVFKDEHGCSGYRILSDRSIECYITNADNTWFIKFASLDDMVNIAIGLQRIVQGIHTHD